MLDALVDAILNAAKIVSGGNENAPIFEMLLRDKTRGALKRPILGGQLEAMRGWIDTLAKSENPMLQAYSGQVAAAVHAADNAVAALDQAKQRNRHFRLMGERKALIDGTNAARKATDGTLGELPHKFPEQNLPASFGMRFFKRPAPKRSAEQAPRTAAELAAKIAGLDEELAALRAEHEEMLVAEAEAAKGQAQREADTAALAEADRAVEEALAKRAALKAKLDQ